MYKLDENLTLEENVSEDKEKDKVLYPVLFFILCICGLVFISFKNFLLFHSIAEIFSIIIAFIIFIIAVNTYKFNKTHQFLTVLGIAYGFIAGFDLLHTLAYKGMGVFPEHTANLPTQLWIIARYMESFSLLAAVVFLNKKMKIHIVIGFYLIVSSILLLTLFKWNIFPDCFIEGKGLTHFKKVSEYIIAFILMISMYMLTKRKKYFEKGVFGFFLTSLILTTISEILFIFYIDVYDLSNMIGHIFKVLSFYCIYKSVVIISIRLPYEELYRTGRDYYRFIQLLPEAIFAYKDERIIFVNKAGVELLGASHHKDIIGRSIWEIIPPAHERDVKALVRQIQEEARVVHTDEQQIIAMDGKIIDVKLRVALNIYDDHSSVLLIMKDISAHKSSEKLKKTLEEEKQKLKETIEYDKVKTAFFSTISHELKTPLNVILGTIQLLEISKEATDHKSTKYVKNMKKNCYRLLRLINNLIDITKIDSGFFKLNLQNYDIVYLVEEIVLSVTDYTESRGIQLVFDTEIEERMIACDPDKIERIMLNLLSNAIKFTDNEGTIMVKIVEGEESIVISVKDSGIGIPKEKIHTIFERFVQVEQSLIKNHGGSGIGLSLVKALVTMHNGKINVQSEEGKGSEFIIEIPIGVVNEINVTVGEFDSIKENRTERINVEFSDIYTAS